MIKTQSEHVEPNENKQHEFKKTFKEDDGKRRVPIHFTILICKKEKVWTQVDVLGFRVKVNKKTLNLHPLVDFTEVTQWA